MEELQLDAIRKQTKDVLRELMEKADLKQGQILVVGCSSSEIGSFKIGSHSSGEIGQAVYEALYEELKPAGIYLAAQCCEHLNRALILEEEAALKYGYEPVNVVPQLKAGGSFATAAYHTLEHPAAVEHIRAHAGIDIGAKQVLLNYLVKINKELGITIVMTSSELNELRSVCDRIAIIGQGTVQGILKPDSPNVDFALLMSGEGGENHD